MSGLSKQSQLAIVSRSCRTAVVVDGADGGHGPGVLVTMPMFGDMRFNYAVAFHADHLGSFPENVYHSYFIRPIGYRCLHYGLYRAAALVVDSRSPFAFELVARLMYYSGFVLLAAWFFWLLRGGSRPWGFIGWKRCFFFSWDCWPRRIKSTSNPRNLRCS